jgi:hypothetical protein
MVRINGLLVKKFTSDYLSNSGKPKFLHMQKHDNPEPSPDIISGKV